ncbi:hypothetical protein BVRB_006240 [Beta vulgaris subsp. vulgaris]|uniref:DUF6598 domain-containing protein n=1 Tax=Beta vulgaris subsp. vulgaris TaxID=3555 RepID=A0A0J8B3E1_BETVV|nr:uncharacterized protein LOC104884131 [Beta vulgaris subsp. vulgaris]KMS95649.1 hypothetical protein BVRB_006240 [Beta vulgaris subsp. vulgaris]
MASIKQCKEMIVKFSNNVQATISVKLINGDGEDPADVYGRIAGRFGIGSEFVLFDKSQSQRIEVRPEEFIPLERDEVVVPAEASELEITAHLMDYDTISPDDEIANGKAVFLVKSAGQSDKKPIAGQYGSIEVNVVWG